MSGQETTILFIIGMFVLGAGMFWLRGSSKFEEWTNRGKTTGDLVWAFVVSAPMLMFLDWYNVIGLALALFVGGRAPWWKSIDMGRNTTTFDNTTFLHDVVMQTIRGVLWVLPAAAFVFFVIDWMADTRALWLLGVGLLCAPAYEFGWRLNPLEKWRPSATEIGELLFGGAIGLGLALTFI